MSNSGLINQRKRIPGHVERVGLFGGSFDPIHLGHLILAQAALEELDLDRLIFIPASISPFKSHLAPPLSSANRLEMIRLAIEGEPQFSVDDRELYREGPSYTIDTVRSLMGDYPGVRFLYLIGADNVHDLSAWHESEELKNLIDFAVFIRSGEGSSQTIGFPVVRRRIDVSSTEIRERLAKGLSVRYLLPSPVYEYITTHRLYRSLSDDQVQD